MVVHLKLPASLTVHHILHVPRIKPVEESAPRPLTLPQHISLTGSRPTLYTWWTGRDTCRRTTLGFPGSFSVSTRTTLRKQEVCQEALIEGGVPSVSGSYSLSCHVCLAPAALRRNCLPRFQLQPTAASDLHISDLFTEAPDRHSALDRCIACVVYSPDILKLPVCSLSRVD